MKENYFRIKSNFFLDILIFLLFSVIYLPIKTVVTSFYADKYSTYFKLTFVHFNTEFKIIAAIFIIAIFTFYIIKKYNFAIKNLFILILLLIIPTGYFILDTRINNFDIQEAKVSKMVGEAQFLGGNLVDKASGTKIKPEAEKLLSMASNDTERSSAYYSLANAELMLNNGIIALDYINKSIIINGSSGEYSLKSGIQRNLQDFIGARISAEKCLDIAKEKDLLLKQATCEIEIAQTYMDEGEITHHFYDKNFFSKAKEHTENAILLNPEQSYYKLFLNRIILDDAISDFVLGDNKTAILKFSEFLKNIDVYKNKQLIARAYGSRGDAEVNIGNYKDGLDDLQKSLEIDKSEAKSAYTDMALAYETMGDNKTAIIYYDKALAEKSERNYPLDSYILENKKRAEGKLENF
ncbi:MAG: tetratricopeptide repeat protein [Candidatus Paceibacterota bacterium]